MQTTVRSDPDPELPAVLVLARLARRYPVWAPAIEACLEQARQEKAVAHLAELLGKPAGPSSEPQGDGGAIVNGAP